MKFSNLLRKYCSSSSSSSSSSSPSSSSSSSFSSSIDHELFYYSKLPPTLVSSLRQAIFLLLLWRSCAPLVINISLIPFLEIESFHSCLLCFHHVSVTAKVSVSLHASLMFVLGSLRLVFAFNLFNFDDLRFSYRCPGFHSKGT